MDATFKKDHAVAPVILTGIDKIVHNFDILYPSFHAGTIFAVTY